MYIKILKKLKELNIDFDEIEHEESKSCLDSKKFRTEAWLSWIWSKNIVFHAKWNFYFVTTIWDKDIKARKFKKEFWTKDIRFASQDEITLVVDSIIWSVPPFWFENNDINIFVDREIFEYEYFMFNPWIATKTIRIKVVDLEKIYKSLDNEIKIFDFRWDEAIFSLFNK